MARRPPSATRQYDVLDALRKHKQQFGMAPTHRELMSYTGITSTSVISYYLDLLERDGLVCRIPGIPRSLDLTESGVCFDRDAYRSSFAGPAIERVSTRPHLIYRAWKMERNYRFYYQIRRSHFSEHLSR